MGDPSGAAVADDVLLTAWRGGDNATGQALFERYYDAIARFYVNKLAQPDGDLIQKTFLACAEGRDRFRGEGSFRSYLFAIAYRQLARYFRDQHGDRVDLTVRTLHDLQPSPSAVAAGQQELRLLLLGLRSIPFDQQVVLELHYWEEMSTQEIADVLALAPGTVKSRMRLGRQHLRAAMQAQAERPGVAQTTVDNLGQWVQRVRDGALAPS